MANLKIINILKKYYLPWFIGLSILFYLKVLVSKSVNPIEKDLIFVTVLVFFTTIFIGTILYFQDNVWGPKRRVKIYSKSPFVELKEKEFEKINDEWVSEISGYTVIIKYSWSTPSGGSGISITTLFNPLKNNIPLSEIDFKYLHSKYSKKKFKFGYDVIGYDFQFNFIPPKVDKIMSIIDESIKILKEEHFKPITIEELSAVSEEYIRTHNFEKIKKMAITLGCRPW